MSERAYEMRVVTAWELLALRREIAARPCADERERALFSNAALLAKCLTHRGEAVFADAEDVLRALGAGEINDLVERYARVDGIAAPEPSEEENAGFDMARFLRLKEGGGV